MTEGVNLIGRIRFRGVDVKVYSDSYSNDTIQICWGMRNPQSVYTGIVYRNLETGMITYPEGAVIPDQTEKDRESIPKFVVIGSPDEYRRMSGSIMKRLETDYVRKNKK